MANTGRFKIIRGQTRDSQKSISPKGAARLEVTNFRESVLYNILKGLRLALTRSPTRMRSRAFSVAQLGLNDRERRSVEFHGIEVRFWNSQQREWGSWKR